MDQESVITDPTVVDKSYLGQAIGRQGCQMLFKTRYFVTARFFDVAKTNLLILDDFALHSTDQSDREHLFDVIDQRYGKASTIICSQIPVSGWHKLIGEGTIADAILGRVVYSSHRIELQGESLRKNNV